MKELRSTDEQIIGFLKQVEGQDAKIDHGLRIGRGRRPWRAGLTHLGEPQIPDELPQCATAYWAVICGKHRPRNTERLGASWASTRARQGTTTTIRDS